MRQFLRKRGLVAVLSTIALVGMVGMTQPASAGTFNPTFRTQVTPNGVGDLLIFGYWTTEDRDSLIAITNTFGGQAERFVHIIIYEGINSAERLNFTICLSPGDVWTAAITRDGPTSSNSSLIVGNPGTCDGSVANSSLTRPPLPVAAGGSPAPISGATFGYIEAYTMECITGASAFAGQIPGIPPFTQCPTPTLQNQTGSPPFGNDDGGDDTLMGVATLVNATAGFSSSYNATSLIGYDALDESANVHNNSNDGRAHQFFPDQGFPGPTVGPVVLAPGAATAVSAGSARRDVANALANEAGVSKEILMGRYTANPAFNSSTDIVLTFPTGDQTGAADPVSFFVFDEEEVFRFSPRGIILNWEVNICRFANNSVTPSGQTEFACNGRDGDIIAGQGSDFTGGWFRILNNNDLIGPGTVVTPGSVIGGNTVPPVLLGAAAIGDGSGTEFNNINAIPDQTFAVIALAFSFFEGINGIFDQGYPIQWAAVTGQGGIGSPIFCSPAAASTGYIQCNGWNIASQYQPHGVPGGFLLPANDTGFGRNRRSNSGAND